MIWPVVDHVAALAQALEIAPAIAGWIVVYVRRGQDDLGGAEADSFDQIRPSARSPLPRAPGLHLGVVPAAIGEAAHDDAVRTAANLTPTLCSFETDDTADLGPVSGVEVAKVLTNRHAPNLIETVCSVQHAG